MSAVSRTISTQIIKTFYDRTVKSRVNDLNTPELAAWIRILCRNGVEALLNTGTKTKIYLKRLLQPTVTRKTKEVINKITQVV